MLLQFHHYLKDNLLTSDYVRRCLYLQMVFLGSEFCTWPCNTPLNVMKVIRRYRKISGKMDMFYGRAYFQKFRRV